MQRFAIMSFAFFVVTVCLSARPAAADLVSRDNPYRSFNISGVNYGSMQWERAHRGKSTSSKRGAAVVFRRR